MYFGRKLARFYLGVLASLAATILSASVSSSDSNTSKDWPRLLLSWSKNAIVDTLTISTSTYAECYLHIDPCNSCGLDEFLSMEAIIAFQGGIELQDFVPLAGCDPLYYHPPPEDIVVGAIADTFYVNCFDCPVLTDLYLLARVGVYLDVEQLSTGYTPSILPVPISVFPAIALNVDPVGGCGFLGWVARCDFSGVYIKVIPTPVARSSWGVIKALYK